ncbi:MAG: hypothetical protein J5965_02825 [Aeriscardovia sp.]|nr:hypothetical protein [Aeriscardovia sp.]
MHKIKRKYTNKYHLKPWVVKTILVTDCIIDGIVGTLKFLGEIIFPAFLLGTALGWITVALLKITGVIL